MAPQSRFNEIKSFVSGGLKDLSVSRTSFAWGVPVPGDSDHVMYVWLDALTNYLTATGWAEGERWGEPVWPSLASQSAHGRQGYSALSCGLLASLFDGGRTAHCLSGFLPMVGGQMKGEKISKSLGNVIDPLALVEEYGLDQTRYFLMREVPFGRDGDFARQMIQRINSDLANDLGNLAQRSLSLIAKI